ncbi:MAG: hypothetical protein EAX81_00875 [Candidatus Thorarchaeota archaeon]|nr:hypothetical protein [Candidatus Thorarchaeota archaeon]
MRFVLLSDIDIAAISVPISHDFRQDGEYKWFLLQTGQNRLFPTMQAYKFRLDSNESGLVDWCFYQKNGLIHSYGSALPNRTNVALLDAAEYYFCMVSHSALPRTVTAFFKPTELEILEPGESLKVNMLQAVEAQQRTFYQLSLLQGVHYEISANCEASMDVAFKIYKGPATGAISLDFSDGGYGETEIVTDLILWGQFSSYSSGRRRPEEPGGAESQLETGWNGDIIDHSRMILELLVESGEGDVTLAVTQSVEAPIVTVGSSIACPLDNYEGPYWYLFQLMDLQGMTVYDITLNHSAGLATSYSVFQSMRFDQSYLYNERQWLDEKSRTYVERRQDYDVHVLWDSYDPGGSQTYLVYQPMAGNQWLLVEVPNIDISSRLTGEINVSIKASPHFDATMGNSQHIDVKENQAAVLRIPLESSHTYGIEITAINGSSYADCALYNESGFFLTGQFEYLWYYTPRQKNEDVRYRCYYIASTGLHAFIISGDGDAPVTVRIFELGQAIPIDLTITFLGMIGAASGGIVVGVLIGRRKYGPVIK